MGTEPHNDESFIFFFSSIDQKERKKERNFNPINWDFEIYWLWMVTLIFFLCSLVMGEREG